METDEQLAGTASAKPAMTLVRPAGTLSLDTSKYLPYLAEFELTEAQQIEMLEALWSIMKTFVDIGFGVDPVQQILPALIAGAFQSEPDGIEPDSASLVTGAARFKKED